MDRRRDAFGATGHGAEERFRIAECGLRIEERRRAQGARLFESVGLAVIGSLRFAVICCERRDERDGDVQLAAGS